MSRCETTGVTAAGRRKRAAAATVIAQAAIAQAAIAKAIITGLATLGVAAGLAVSAPGAAAMTPFPFFQQLDRIGLLCAIDAAPDIAVAGTAMEEGALCGLAEAALASLLGPGGPPVTVFGRNDERIADPTTLLVLIHATLRRPQPAEQPAGQIGGGGTGSVLALSATLQRSRTDGHQTGSRRTDIGDPPFFAAPPQAVVAPDGAPGSEAVREALFRLLSGVARPLLANRPGRP
jgi:hypothetical protein